MPARACERPLETFTVRGTNVRRLIPGLAMTGVLIAGACSRAERDPSARDSSAGPAPAIASVYTSLRDSSCTREVDKDDPDETPYFACAGTAGYSLIVRRVDAGRRSVDVVDAAKRVFPLDFPQSVTPHMSALGARAEWRVATEAGASVPIALIVPLESHENADDPAIVTHTWLAVAKIAPDTACVVDRIRQGERSEAEVRMVADSARARPCVPAPSR